jgi:hypothetical protein
MRRIVPVFWICSALLPFAGCGSGEGQLSGEQKQQYEQAVQKMQNIPGMNPQATNPDAPTKGAQQGPYGAGYPGAS